MITLAITGKDGGVGGGLKASDGHARADCSAGKQMPKERTAGLFFALLRQESLKLWILCGSLARSPDVAN